MKRCKHAILQYRITKLGLLVGGAFSTPQLALCAQALAGGRWTERGRYRLNLATKPWNLQESSTGSADS